ncbi:class I SAM-dependent methyltransferase [Amycolatopsis anabasis]|uniref:class I SAM-dependent methyltransferase n=1 Tax=Amycolatopsis anabasis TaxID=1840409 RepID=UPI00131DA901|nr:class I SAM-dependent methyltransferase [Amycolatopsis anabasis]
MADEADAGRYGQAWADIYDDWFGDLDDTGPAVEVLAELAAGGPALEIGPGTGRLTIPLAERGIEVTAVESSARMAERLTGKLTGQRISVVVADAATIDLGPHAPPGGFALAYLSCNTLFQLTEQEAQLNCVRAIGRVLAPSGSLVVEASAPHCALLAAGNKNDVRTYEDGSVAITTTRADVATQRLDTTVVLLARGHRRVLPVPERFIWPAELDLMARLAGLSRAHRWSGWERGPFGATSTGHVSVYARDRRGDWERE